MDSMGGILTKGLGASACVHMILGPFRLHIDDVHTTPTSETSSGGGNSIRPSSTAYQILHSKDYSHDEDEVLLPVKKQIRLTYKIQGITYDKTFIVDKTTTDRVIKTTKWLNKTTNSIKITINNMINKI